MVGTCENVQEVKGGDSQELKGLKEFPGGEGVTGKCVYDCRTKAK